MARQYFDGYFGQNPVGGSSCQQKRSPERVRLIKHLFLIIYREHAHFYSERVLKQRELLECCFVFFLIDVVACWVYRPPGSTQVYTYSPDVAQFKIKCTLVECK